uniref:Uncharacterized protein n=1 Tax=Arundo donax TaxID=35708 RepID=A0A0A8ZPK4_ARUDO
MLQIISHLEIRLDKVALALFIRVYYPMDVRLLSKGVWMYPINSISKN